MLYKWLCQIEVKLKCLIAHVRSSAKFLFVASYYSCIGLKQVVASVTTVTVTTVTVTTITVTTLGRFVQMAQPESCVLTMTKRTIFI